MYIVYIHYTCTCNAKKNVNVVHLHIDFTLHNNYYTCTFNVHV